jgi:hypothetical protein
VLRSIEDRSSQRQREKMIDSLLDNNKVIITFLRLCVADNNNKNGSLHATIRATRISQTVIINAREEKEKTKK